MLEEESGGVLRVASVTESSGKVNPTGTDKQVSEIEKMVNKSSEAPKAHCLQPYGGDKDKQVGRDCSPNPTDVSRACNGHGHWAHSCLTFNRNRAGQGL